MVTDLKDWAKDHGYNPCGEVPLKPSELEYNMTYSPESVPECPEENLSSEEKLARDLEEIDRKYAPIIVEAKERLRRLHDRHTALANQPDKPSGWRSLCELVVTFISAVAGSGAGIGLYHWL